MSVRISVVETKAPELCPLCRAGLEAERAFACPACATLYHQQCLVDLGGCATLGCRHKGEVPPGAGPRRRELPRGTSPDGHVVFVALVAMVVGLAAVGLTLAASAFAHRPPPSPPPPASRIAPPPPPPLPRPAPRVAAPLPPPTTVPRLSVAADPWAVRQAAHDVAHAFYLRSLAEQIEQGRGDPWTRQFLEEGLKHPDPVPAARAVIHRASALGVKMDELQTMVRDAALRGYAEADELVTLVCYDRAPTPFADLHARLESAIARLDAQAGRETATTSYLQALDEARRRESLVKALEPLVEDAGSRLDLGLWRDRLGSSPDPHLAAREARRRFLAAGGVEAGGAHPAEVRVGQLLAQVHGVVDADGTPTPTQRLLAAIAEREAR